MSACGDGEKPEPKQGDVDSDGVNYLTVSVYFAGTLSCFCMRCTTPPAEEGPTQGRESEGPTGKHFTS